MPTKTKSQPSRRRADDARTEEHLSIIGKPNVKIDAMAKVTGETIFADDMALPRMLFCKMKRSPHPHARILSVDTSKAEAMPGVVATLVGSGASHFVRHSPGVSGRACACHRQGSLRGGSGGRRCGRRRADGGRSAPENRRKLKPLLLDVASKKLSVPVERLRMAHRRVFDREHPDEAMSFAEAAVLAVKRRQFEPKVLVGLRGLPGERTVSGSAEGGVTIDGMMTLTAVSENQLLREHFPALARGAELVSSPALRNMGTIGGNLCIDTRCNYYDQNYEWREAIDFCMKKDGAICWVAPSSPRCWAISSSDTAPVFIALGAQVTLVGPEGERRIPVKALYRRDGIEFLTKRREEILTEIHVPKANGLRATYLKLRRRGSIDFPILGVAAALRAAKDGTVEHARIVLTAVESAPVEAEAAEKFLVGQKLGPETIEEAASMAYRPARPLDNTDLTHAYRKKMARVYVARALSELA